MKKIKNFVLGVIALFLIAMPVLVLSADTLKDKQYGAGTVYSGSLLRYLGISQMSPTAMAQLIVRSILGFVGVIFFLMFVYAGYTWIKARDTSAEIEKAKNIIESALYGIIIISLAYAVSEFIFGQLMQ